MLVLLVAVVVDVAGEVVAALVVAVVVTETSVADELWTQLASRHPAGASPATEAVLRDARHHR